MQSVPKDNDVEVMSVVQNVMRITSVPKANCAQTRVNVKIYLHVQAIVIAWRAVVRVGSAECVPKMGIAEARKFA